MKKKLTLDLDTLAVATFATEAAAEARGTVQGHDVPTGVWCQANSYQSYCPDSLCTCPPPRD